MDKSLQMFSALLLISAFVFIPAASGGTRHWSDKSRWGQDRSVQLGPRPYYLVQDMDDDTPQKTQLKKQLEECSDGPFHKTVFSIGHRGAGLQFPEHTRESYTAAARMGAGIVECDVTFTKDRELVCRHSQCDLHTTTNILASPDLAAKCSQPFTPAEFDEDGNLVKPASAMCCTSDITLDEFKSLCGKMDAYNPCATTAEAYMQGTPDWRTDLYATCGTVMTHAESIELFKDLKVKMTPELKSPSVEMPYEGTYTQEDFARQMIDEYNAAGVPPRDVYPQSFNLDDIRYWVASTPGYGRQAVYLDGRYDDPAFDHTDAGTWNPGMEELKSMGVNIIAPPMWMLLRTGEDGAIEPSRYAQQAKSAGLDIITWTLERSGTLTDGGEWYYQTVTDAIDNSGDTYTALDVLAREVGIIGIFSDWPATVTYYANCMGLGNNDGRQRR
jgi:glycerophosphoryl diester phosphodiesterase